MSNLDRLWNLLDSKVDLAAWNDYMHFEDVVSLLKLSKIIFLRLLQVSCTVV